MFCCFFVCLAKPIFSKVIAVPPCQSTTPEPLRKIPAGRWCSPPPLPHYYSYHYLKKNVLTVFTGFLSLQNAFLYQLSFYQSASQPLALKFVMKSLIYAQHAFLLSCILPFIFFYTIKLPASDTSHIRKILARNIRVPNSVSSSANKE